MAGTQLVTVQSGLVDFIAALPGLGDVQVSYAWPGETKTEHSAVWFAEATADIEQASIRSGTRRRLESITLKAIIEVIGKGLSQAETDTAAVAILTAIDEGLAADVYAGMNDIVEWIIPRNWTRAQGQLDTGHGSRFELSLEVSTRIL